MAWLRLFAAAVALVGPGHAMRPTVATVASTGGRTWFAVADRDELTIYRFDHLHLHVDGAVRLPTGFPIRFGETVTATYVIPGDAPSFAIRQWGADTLWFALAARLRGRWHMVPFDDMYARRHRYTFALGASHHLIHGFFDSCGCASGPTTEQWYRFARGVFVATAPPGAPADCSAETLSTAPHWPRLTYEPLLRSIDRTLDVDTFACAAGWALATDGRQVAVFEQRGRGWLRVGIGSPRLVRSARYAMPRSLFAQLARRIGLPGLNHS